jgi:hypothetical protein
MEKIQGGTRRTRPVGLPVNTAAHDKGGGGRVLADLTWRVRVLKKRTWLNGEDFMLFSTLQLKF